MKAIAQVIRRCGSGAELLSHAEHGNEFIASADRRYSHNRYLRHDWKGRLHVLAA